MVIGGLAGDSPSRRLVPGFETIVTRYFENEVTIITLANLAEADLA
jgi:hypothetical protein